MDPALKISYKDAGSTRASPFSDGIVQSNSCSRSCGVKQGKALGAIISALL
jgi:hypothetical protein